MVWINQVAQSCYWDPNLKLSIISTYWCVHVYSHHVIVALFFWNLVWLSVICRHRKQAMKPMQQEFYRLSNYLVSCMGWLVIIQHTHTHTHMYICFCCALKHMCRVISVKRWAEKCTHYLGQFCFKIAIETSINWTFALCFSIPFVDIGCSFLYLPGTEREEL